MKSTIRIATMMFLCGTAWAHHGNSAYDETARVPIKGTVTEIVWSNPHVQVYLDVKDAKGNIVHWAVETNSPGILTRAGWTRRSIKPGDVVTIILCPAKNGAPVAYMGTGDPGTKVTRRFNRLGMGALDDLPRSGPHRTYGPAAQARMLQEVRRAPDRKEDATGTWSLALLQRALRAAPDGLPKVSTFTILHTLHEAGYTWQKSRTWCHTGRTLKKAKDGTVSQSEDPYTLEKKR